MKRVPNTLRELFDGVKEVTKEQVASGVTKPDFVICGTTVDAVRIGVTKDVPCDECGIMVVLSDASPQDIPRICTGCAYNKAIGKLEKTKIERLYVCGCGHICFTDDVKIGMEYEVDRLKIHTFSLPCGGCKEMMTLDWVPALRHDTKAAGLMPLSVFDL